MGQATNKMTPDDARDRVTHLRDAIAVKREQITAEIGELKRRRTEAVHTTVKTGKALGIAAVGLLCAASLINAIADLFRDESDVEIAPQEHPFRSDLSMALAGFAMTALKIAAAQFVRYQLTEYTQRVRQQDNATAIDI